MARRVGFAGGPAPGAGRAEIEAIALDQVRSRIGDVRGAGALPGLADRVVAGELDPYRAADALLDTALPTEGP